jgi:hypothetical protein
VRTRTTDGSLILPSPRAAKTDTRPSDMPPLAQGGSHDEPSLRDAILAVLAEEKKDT